MGYGEACGTAAAHADRGEATAALAALLPFCNPVLPHDLRPALAVLDRLEGSPDAVMAAGRIRILGDRRVRDAARGRREVEDAMPSFPPDMRALSLMLLATSRMAAVGGDADLAAAHLEAAGALGEADGWYAALGIHARRASRGDAAAGARGVACAVACHEAAPDAGGLDLAARLLRGARAGGLRLGAPLPARGVPRGIALDRLRAWACAMVTGPARRPIPPRHWPLDADAPPPARPADLRRAEAAAREVSNAFGAFRGEAETAVAAMLGYEDWPALEADVARGPAAPADEDLDAAARGARREWQAHALKRQLGLDDLPAVEGARMLSPSSREGRPSLARLEEGLSDRLFPISENAVRDGLDAMLAELGIDLGGADPFSAIRRAAPLRQDLWLGVAAGLGWTFSWTDLHAEGHGVKVAETVDAEGRTWPVHASPVCHAPGDDDDEDVPDAMRRVEAGGPRGVLAFTRNVMLEEPGGDRRAVYGGMTYDAARTPRERWRAFFLADGQGIDAVIERRGLYEADDAASFWDRCGVPKARAATIAHAIMEAPRGRPATFDGKVIPTTKRGLADMMG